MPVIKIQREISREIPKLPPRFIPTGTTPLFIAFDCVLTERDTGKSCIYIAVNLTTGMSEIVCRRKTPLTTSGEAAMVEKIRNSSVAGAGIFQADRPFRDRQTLENCHKILTAVFTEILPEYGYAIRKEQISLAKHILDAIAGRKISLAESEVGTGKTLAYLIAAILVKRGRLNDMENSRFYSEISYAALANMPIVIATSSIALQKALFTDYIPELSRILMAHKIITKPLTAVVRKGREHYICERNLHDFIPFVRDKKTLNILAKLLFSTSEIDCAEIDGLTVFVKKQISVPAKCERNCVYRNTCRYFKFRDEAALPTIDIQICNHNYFLADIIHRKENKLHLIPNYQSIIIDESHKFLDAARSMYGCEISDLMLSETRKNITDISDKNQRKLLSKLLKESNRLFKNAECFDTIIDDEMSRHIRNIYNISDTIINLMTNEPLVGVDAKINAKIMWELERTKKQTAAFSEHDNLICWREKRRNENCICAIPKNLNQRLHTDIWSRGIPIIFTSGTLSANGDFSHIKRTLGLDLVKRNIIETSKPSPFNYRKNALIYTSKNVPFPNPNCAKYIAALTLEIESLIRASRGHAAVLFTSYKALGLVYSNLQKCGLKYHFFRLDKGGICEIERFKKSGNGVIFAAGSLWEGIDIPGDTLSMLIIVKLPFAVPDQISEYERTLYPNSSEYKNKMIIPEMLIKCKQGFGRGIRSETDTCVFAILDSRVCEGGKYRKIVFDALPKTRITSSITDIEKFYIKNKPPEYFT